MRRLWSSTSDRRSPRCTTLASGWSRRSHHDPQVVAEGKACERCALRVSGSTSSVRIPSNGACGIRSRAEPGASNPWSAHRSVRVCPGRSRCWAGDHPFRPSPAKPLVDGTVCGAGGNRTPVHQPVHELATTIPDIEAVAASLAGQMSTEVDHAPSFRCVSGLSRRQRSFPPSSLTSGAGL